MVRRAHHRATQVPVTDAAVAGEPGIRQNRPVGLRDQVDRDVRAFKFNKVVSGFMEFYNRHKHVRPDEDTARRIEALLRVFAPGFRAGP